MTISSHSTISSLSPTSKVIPGGWCAYRRFHILTFSHAHILIFRLLTSLPIIYFIILEISRLSPISNPPHSLSRFDQQETCCRITTIYGLFLVICFASNGKRANSRALMNKVISHVSRYSGLIGVSGVDIHDGQFCKFPGAFPPPWNITEDFS